MFTGLQLAQWYFSLQILKNVMSLGVFLETPSLHVKCEIFTEEQYPLAVLFFLREVIDFIKSK